MSAWSGVALSVAVMTALLIGGCGSGGDMSDNSVNRSMGATASRAQEKYAEVVNLHPADAPTMTPISTEGETMASEFASEVTRCGGGLPGWEAKTIHSFRLERAQDQEVVMSAIHVLPSAAIAKRNIASDLSARFQVCIERAFDSQPPSGPLVKKNTVVSRLVVPLPINATVSNSFGMRMVPRISYRSATGKRIKTPYGQDVVQDAIGFALDRAEVVLIDTHGPQTYPSPTERRLLSLLYNRAREHSDMIRS